MPVYIISTLKQKNGSQFPIVEDIDLKGGYRIVANISARNSIFTSMRKEGMRVHVVSENKDYKLKVGLTNADWEVVADGSAFELLGFPTIGDWTNSFLRLDENTRKTDAIYRADQILGKLAPTRPDDLSSKTLSMATYVALEASTGISHVCVSDTTPTAIVENFGDGDIGTLIAYIDTVNAGSVVLSTASDVGSYGALNVTADEDPYVGQSGKEGIYKQLSANITPVAAMSIGQHGFYMEHSVTGITPVVNFYVDNPVVSTVSNVMISLPGGNTRFISGVPSLKATDILLFSFRINNAVKTHYNAVKLGVVSGANINDFNAATPISPPVNGASVDYLSKQTNPVGYAETIPVIITPYSSNDAAGTPYNGIIPARVDLISNESIRVLSGAGQYPASGYGGVFNSTVSLKTVYTDELQLLNGKYQRPSGDYTLNQPTAGENYNVSMGVADRRVTFAPVVLTNSSAFTLNILGAEGFVGAETAGVEIQVKIEGATGWLNANAAYSGTGNPVNDGDSAMVFGASDNDTKRVTFGTVVRSGQLYVRIMFPNGSTKKISGVSITNIV